MLVLPLVSILSRQQLIHCFEVDDLKSFSLCKKQFLMCTYLTTYSPYSLGLGSCFVCNYIYKSTIFNTTYSSYLTRCPIFSYPVCYLISQLAASIVMLKLLNILARHLICEDTKMLRNTQVIRLFQFKCCINYTDSYIVITAIFLVSHPITVRQSIYAFNCLM